MSLNDTTPPLFLVIPDTFARETQIPRATDARIQHFQSTLLRWFRTHGRDLPWRRTRNPYHILVSEMMLHQTQVDRVIPKYHEFLEKYPTFDALAKAPVEEVEQLWRPLGYNFRPTRLHAIACCVMQQHNGKLPNTLEGLQSLCGIGRYTAGAILSFAFHKDAPILDTNVRRVLQRFFGIPGNPHRAPAVKQLWRLAEHVIPPGQGYLFNQALLDFGALLCTARSPSCPGCPFHDYCPFPATQ